MPAAMKMLALVLALCATSAQAVPLLLGKIAATTSAAKNQTDTAAAFSIPQNQKILIDCRDDSNNPADAYLRWVTATTTAATAATSLRASFLLTTNGVAYQYLSVLGISGNINCFVFKVDP